MELIYDSYGDQELSRDDEEESYESSSLVA
jgi:hypothetical protein